MQDSSHSSLETLDDDALMDRYRKERDAAALDALVRRHTAALMRYLRGMFRAAADVEDAFQEVWLRVIRRSDAYRSHNFKGWLLRIAHNVSIDRYRRDRGLLSLDAESADGTRRTLADTLAAGGASPRQGAETTDELRRIVAGVQALPAAQREVFLMRVGAELSFKQIAHVLHIPLNTALGRMHYAVVRLRASLSEAPSLQPTGRSP